MSTKVPTRLSTKVSDSKNSRRTIKESMVSIGSDRTKLLRLTRNKRKRIFLKRNELKIMYENQDVTPAILESIAQYNTIKQDKISQSQIEIMKSQQGTSEGVFSTFGTSTLNLQTQVQTINFSILNQTTMSIVHTDDTASEPSISWAAESNEILNELYEIPEKIDTTMPTRMSIVLVETPVTYLFQMTSISEQKDSEEGEKIARDNEYYDYLTIGKGRNRKTVNAEVQTTQRVLKTRSTYTESTKQKSSYAFASVWDMLDTYTGKSSVVQGKTVTATMPNSDSPNYEEFMKNLDEQMLKLLKNPNFHNSVIVIERILASNNYNTQQKRFRGLIEQDPFRPDISFKYNLDLLWTFKNEKTQGHPVTSMQWNPANKDILAVGYGKFFYNENKNGFIYLWNIKNPTQPEREYYFSKPVTSVAFSNHAPNILAVGLYDGNVTTLDITKKDIIVMAVTAPTFSPSHDPIWQVAWLPPDDYHPNDEYLVCVSEDGRLNRLTPSKTDQFMATQLNRTLPIEGKLKGVYQPRHCPVTDVPLTKCSAGLFIALHPSDKNKYFLGTDEGTIHRCSRHYLNEHIDMFLAHNGPVYGCQFSPFCHKLFLTCGADWNVNIWAEEYLKPLITLTKTMEAVEGACWSPSNCTIVANIVGSDIIIWDLQRRTYLPAAVHKNPNNLRNTLIQFTDSGRNLVVADIEGNVHVFSLEDMPFPPFYQSEILLQVIKKTIVCNKEVLDQFDQIF